MERQRATDSLKKGLGKRPEREELIERKLDPRIPIRITSGVALLTKQSNLGNILLDSTAAPALQGQQRELEKHMRADSLEQKIQHRPKPEELIKEGILTVDEDPTKE